MGRKVKTEEQKQKAREYARQWRKDNPEKCREYHKVYAEKYAEKERLRHKEKSTRSRKLYPERQRAADRKWMETHREAHRAKAHKYRTKKRNGGVYLVLPKELKRLSSQPCAACGTYERISIDHIVPIARGGRHSIGNLQPLCILCNSSKGAKFMTEWKSTKEIN